MLAKIADAGLTDKLELALRRYAKDSDTVRLIRETIDQHGIRSPELVRRLGDLTRAGVLAPRLFPRLAKIQDALEVATPGRREPAQPPARADLKAHRGPGDPMLLRLGTDYPVPLDKLHPRQHTQGRRIFEYLLTHKVTRLELCEAGERGGWSADSAKQWWARLQSPQMARSGWLLDLEDSRGARPCDNRRGQLVQLPPNWDFRAGKPL